MKILMPLETRNQHKEQIAKVSKVIFNLKYS